MIIAILVRESLADSVEDIGGKMVKLGEHWGAECKAPLGEPGKRVTYSLPDPKTVRYTIKDYLERPSAYQKRR